VLAVGCVARLGYGRVAEFAALRSGRGVRAWDRIMQKRLIPAFVLAAYSAVVVRILVFKIGHLQIGPLRFRFAAEAGEANLLPFNTILPYLRGEPNWLIAILNLAGNIGLLAPVGFLVPFVYRNMNWGKSLVLAIGVGVAIEGAQTVLIGIFDIDDVILNALGVMIGYWAFVIFEKRARPRLQPS
jgi:glycopeptide antibiotics resistance protein